MIPAQATLWSKAAVATASDLRKRVVAGARDLGGAGLAGLRRTRAEIAGATSRTRTAALNFAAAVVEHRHGTWLVLFAILFTLLWLLAGWIGMDNGVVRGLLVGTTTPILISRLFPLKRAVR